MTGGCFFCIIFQLMKCQRGFYRAGVRTLGCVLVLLSGFPLLLGQAFAHTHFKEKRWELRTGYAYQYTNNSRPNNFQIIPLYPSLAVPLTDIKGSSWYRGRFVLNPELFLASFTHPYVRPIFGVTPIQFSYSFEPAKSRFSPYLFAGAGVLWADVDRRETRSRTNFNLQGGAGTRYRMTEKTSLILEYRHIHISNAGLHEDNAGLNTNTFLVGVSVKD